MRTRTAALALLVLSAASVARGQTAGQILQATGVRGGIVVHIGCNNVDRIAALRADESFLVHALDTRAAAVDKARTHLHAKGVYGPVSAAQFGGRRLPYAEGMVNLLIAEDPGPLKGEEILRVLVPGGVARIKADGRSSTIRKPWPDNIDQWSHFLHDASNDCTARDTVVGPPRRLKWHCGPLWARSHEHTISLVQMVSAGGRVFYVFDEGLTGVHPPTLPERWTLIARDAFNGVLLWKRRLDGYRGKVWLNKSMRGVPPSVPRLMVAEADRLITPLTLDAPVSILDAATGKTLATCDGTEGAQELRCSDGVLLVRTNKPSLQARDATTGKKLWQVTDAVRPQSIAAAGGRVFYQAGAALACVELKTGRPLWKTAAPKPTAKPAASPPRKAKRPRRTKGGGIAPVVVCGSTVLYNGPKGLTAVNVETGKVIWSGKGKLGGEAFVAGGKLWQPGRQGVAGIDLATGEAGDALSTADVFTPGHHPRCHQGKATTNYAITRNRGIEFISLTGGPNSQHDWTRGPCRYGIMPANGLLYVPPNPCFCYPGVKPTGFNTYAAAGKAPPTPGDPLSTGPAYADAAKLAAVRGDTADWPTYRHDGRRTGAAVCEVGVDLGTNWTAKLKAPLTPPVSAGGRAYVAAKNEHTLYALNLADGKIAWRFIAGGRIDSPPTIHGGLILLGCTDGHVYCLRASDGALAWRYRAAPLQRLIVDYSQLESAWRVHGSVLLEGGVAYCTAGRSAFLDGGIRLIGLDPATGKVLHERTVDTWTRTRLDAKGKPFIPAYHIEGSHSDLLVAQGGYLFLGQLRFDRKLVEKKAPYPMPGPNDRTTAMDISKEPYTFVDPELAKGYERYRSFHRWMQTAHAALAKRYEDTYGGMSMGDRATGLHVSATSGFLDDSWFNRTYWMYAPVWPGWYHAHRGAKSGNLLVVGPKRTYAVQAYPTRNRQSPLFDPATKGYLLIADKNETQPVLDYKTRGATKGLGYTRMAPPVWHQWAPIRMRSMVLAGERLFVAGPPDVIDPKDPMAAFDGRKGAVLRAISANDGKILAERTLPTPPVFDGLIAASGRLLVSTRDGKVLCLGGSSNQ